MKGSTWEISQILNCLSSWKVVDAKGQPVWRPRSRDSEYVPRMKREGKEFMCQTHRGIQLTAYPP